MRLQEASDPGSGWRDATALITQYVLAGRESSEVLQEITRVVQQLSVADATVISFANDAGQHIVEVEAITRGQSLLGQEIAPSKFVLSATLGSDQGHDMALTVVATDRKFSVETMDQFLWFTDQVRIAIELGSARRKTEALLVLEDRDRIARDLHDVVIQRLFGAGMQLDSVQRSLIDNTEATAKIDNVLLELDTTIRDIRTTIFALRSPQQAGHQTLKDQVGELVEELANALNLDITYDFRGLEQHEVADQLTKDVLAVVREAITNVAKHADTAAAQLVLQVDDEEIVLTVVNDGKLGQVLTQLSGAELQAQGHSGLVNMLARARKYSGSSLLSQVVGIPSQVRLRWNASMLVRQENHGT